MKFLFVVGNLYPNNDANSNIVKTLATKMVDMGHLVDILGKSEANDAIPQDENIFYYELPELNNINRNLSKSGNLQKAFYLFTHPKERRFWSCMRGSLNFVEDQYVISCKNRIEQLYSENRYDCIISVSMPIWTSIALSSANVGAIKVEYRLDPYAYNQLETKYSFEQKIETEIQILKNMQLAFLPTLDYLDMSNDKHIIPFCEKLFPLEFPNLVKHESHRSELSQKISSEPLTFVFIGYLYEDIRNPKNMLDFFVKLNEDLDFKLYIIGGGCESILESYKKTLKDKLQIISRVDSAEAYAIMSVATYLINLGNTVPNMVPSKIIDYISTGRPILNFTKLENCPTLDYISRYNNGISFHDINWQKQYTQIKAFIEEKHPETDHKAIMDLFKQNTPQFVSEFIIDKISKLI